MLDFHKHYLPFFFLCQTRLNVRKQLQINLKKARLTAMQVRFGSRLALNAIHDVKVNTPDCDSGDSGSIPGE
jgi:hypothetical protein